MYTKSNAKGFTLIELLIVIAIVAILSVVVILTLNPAELLRQARDSNRISDMATLNSALALYLADGGTTLASSYTTCYATAPGALLGQCGGRFTAANYPSMVTSTSRVVTGTGWIAGPNFSSISSGSPLAILPIDPVNDATYYYAYAATSTNSVYELNANLESTRYTSGTSNQENNDGGNTTTLYEVGTKLDM